MVAEYTPLVDTPTDIREAYNALSPSERTSLESSLKRRLDRRLFPCLLTFYLLNYIDRNALPAARLLGLESDLNLSAREYAACLGVLYIGYLLMQIPSNLLMTRFRPSKYLSGWMIVWGMVSMGTAMVQGFKGLFVVRFALGFCEAPFFPGAMFLLSSWYKPTELALRVALLFGGSLLSGSFGALIALGITNVVGDAAGWSAWRWLFITEGSATVIFAIIASFILPDYPHNTRWLTPGESLVAQGRLLKPEDEPEDTTSMLQGFTSMLSDPKVYVLTLNHFLIALSASYTNFFPTILQNLFSSTASRTYLLLTPPYLLAFLATSLLCHHADITNSRTKHIIPSYLVTIFCALSLAYTPNYISLIVITSAIYTALDINLAWVSNTIPSPNAKRAASIAMVNMCSNVANIVGAWVWVGDGKDGFPGAWTVVAGSAAAGVLVTGGFGAWLRRENLRGARYVV